MTRSQRVHWLHYTRRSIVVKHLGQRRRVAYRTLTVPCTLDDDALETLKDALLYAPQIAWDKEGLVLGWTASVTTPPSPPPRSPTPSPGGGPARDGTTL